MKKRNFLLKEHVLFINKQFKAIDEQIRTLQDSKKWIYKAFDTTKQTYYAKLSELVSNGEIEK